MTHYSAMIRVLLVVGSLLATGVAIADEGSPPFPTLVRLTEHARANVRLIGIHRARGDMDGADVLRNYAIVQPAVRVPFAKWGEIDISTRYDVKRYEFGGPSDLVDGLESEGTPFEALHNYRIRAGVNLRSSERIFWSIGAFSRARFEEDADLSEATRVGGFAAFGVQINPNLFAGLGVGFQARYHGGNERVVPLWRIQWQLNDRWQFRVDNARVRLRFKPDRRWRIEVVSGYSERVYRLRDRGEDAATRVEERSIPLYGALMWTFDERNRIELDLGVLFDQRLQTNAAGRRQSITQGVAGYLGFGLRFYSS